MTVPAGIGMSPGRTSAFKASRRVIGAGGRSLKQVQSKKNKGVII